MSLSHTPTDTFDTRVSRYSLAATCDRPALVPGRDGVLIRDSGFVLVDARILRAPNGLPLRFQWLAKRIDRIHPAIEDCY
jgi:hypothetical protein